MSVRLAALLAVWITTPPGGGRPVHGFDLSLGWMDVRLEVIQSRGDAAEVAEALREVLGLAPEGAGSGLHAVQGHAGMNVLVVVGSGPGLDRLHRLLDPPPDPPDPGARGRLRLACLEHVSAGELAGVLRPVLLAMSVRAELVPDPATNCLVVEAGERAHAFLREAIDRLDRVP